MRSQSPTKSQTAARKIATPRRKGKGRGALSKLDEDATSVADSTGSVNGESFSRPTSSANANVKVEVETVLQPDGGDDEEYETTKVNIELPAGYPELELPNDAEAMLATARAMVQEAKRIDAGHCTGKGKRKAEEIEDDDEELAIMAPKRVKAVHTELRKEKIKRRALTGIVAGLAFGYVITCLSLRVLHDRLLTRITALLSPAS
jgi:hypothetical protein